MEILGDIYTIIGKANNSIIAKIVTGVVVFLVGIGIIIYISLNGISVLNRRAELKRQEQQLIAERKNEKLPFKLTTFQQEICDRLSILNYDGLNKISTNFIDILLELVEKEYKKCKKIEKTFLENILADYENTASNFINIISSKSQIDENTKYELIKYIAIQYFRLQKIA